MKRGPKPKGIVQDREPSFASVLKEAMTLLGELAWLRLQVAYYDSWAWRRWAIWKSRRTDR